MQQGEMSHNDNYPRVYQTVPFFVALIPKSLDSKIIFYGQKECYKEIKQQVAFIEEEKLCMIFKNKTIYSEYKNPMQRAIDKLDQRYNTN
ncbi:hypothetical protein M3215_19400 [Bacillus cytotoxicus]|uniref:Uncharacterized protein n=1 Tax=Bacillus cytotoxicus TaxID=580165 RepID=A0ACC6ACC2_9BACI|nr:hypothetical protein [Bacillus cytotoxicus]